MPPAHFLPPLIGDSPAFRQALDHISRAAPLDRPLLIIGERGTGKELIASRLHFLSRRWDKPLIRLNCAALPETLVESELFGHEAGAFTGATRRRPGRFELAEGGSLFLDEIACLSAPAQEKLLRVIEYGDYEPVGGSRTHSADVRLIAATNADLPTLAATGRFRADLLDRLAFDVVTLPPLRARPDDILSLANHYAVRMSAVLGWPLFPGFDSDVRAELEAYAWPGNVRELRNVVERAVYRCPDPESPIAALILDPFASPYRPSPSAEALTSPTPTPVPVPATSPAPPSPPQAAARDFNTLTAAYERALLEAALTSHQFNRRRAAAALGLGYHQFRRLLARHGLTYEDAEDG